ncbi:MAG TPA: ABC transporter permease [Longimicrobiales bacterium]|nr:ABC transporter permease [Longimicrobiales bacterium]
MPERSAPASRRGNLVIGEVVGVAAGAIRANKLRSFLTMLGIIIGIAAVITMVSLGEGAQRSVQERLANLGTNVLTIRPGQSFFGGVDRGDAALTADDSEALLAAGGGIVAVAPEMERRLQVSVGGANGSLSVLGTWPSFFDVNNYALEWGRFFTPGEERGRRRLAVLGATAGERLGVDDTSDLLGKSLQIRGIPFQVIGILEERGDGGWNNPDERVYVPLATAQFRVFGTDRLRSISVQTASPDHMDEVTGTIDGVLRRQHRLQPGEPSDFTIRDQAIFIDTFQETTRTFSFLLAGIALISLLVGGIGIMNIMLVSVTERTKEIGVRKAMGARRKDILLQFLTESLMLCLAGGVVGILLGVGAAVALSRLAEWNTAVAPDAIVLAFGFAAAVGVFFGIWPARRAARLDPIQSLRYE